MWCRAALLIGLLAGCSSSDGRTVPPCSEASATLAVSDAAVPIFTWSPRCLALGLLVRPADSVVGFTWLVQAAGLDNSLEPGIVYGIPPEGAATLEPAVALVNGREYQASLLIIIEVPGGPRSVRIAGTTTFVR